MTVISGARYCIMRRPRPVTAIALHHQINPLARKPAAALSKKPRPPRHRHERTPKPANTTLSADTKTPQPASTFPNNLQLTRLHHESRRRRWWAQGPSPTHQFYLQAPTAALYRPDLAIRAVGDPNRGQNQGQWSTIKYGGLVLTNASRVSTSS